MEVVHLVAGEDNQFVGWYVADETNRAVRHVNIFLCVCLVVNLGQALQVALEGELARPSCRFKQAALHVCDLGEDVLSSRINLYDVSYLGH